MDSKGQDRVPTLSRKDPACVQASPQGGSRLRDHSRSKVMWCREGGENELTKRQRNEGVSQKNRLSVESRLAFINYFPIQKVKFPIIAGLARRLGDRLGTKLQFMVKFLLPKMTSIIDQDGKSGNGGKPDQLSPSFSSATINKSGFPLSSR